VLVKNTANSTTKNSEVQRIAEKFERINLNNPHAPHTSISKTIRIIKISTFSLLVYTT